MLAYKVTEENLPLITVNNGGVTPQIEDEVTYFIIAETGYASIVSETEFTEQYIIRMPINEISGRYLIDRK